MQKRGASLRVDAQASERNLEIPGLVLTAPSGRTVDGLLVASTPRNDERDSAAAEFQPFSRPAALAAVSRPLRLLRKRAAGDRRITRAWAPKIAAAR